MKPERCSSWLSRLFGSSNASRTNRRTIPSFENLEAREFPAAGLREQYMVELINRMRAAPQAELPLLTARPDVQQALAYFNVNQTELTTQFAALTPAAPLAYNDNLATAALTHTQKMLDADTQSHQLPGEKSLGDRITDAGYTWGAVGENVFTRAQDVANAHAAFAIDWGLGANGLQNPAGHRNNIMNAGFTEVGIGVLDTIAGRRSGPILVTQNFGTPATAGNPYIVGVVYNDANNNTFYDIGEGLPGVTVTITSGGNPVATLTTSAAGYYQTQVAAGAYDIEGSGGGLQANVTKTVNVAAANVKADLISAAALPAQISLVSPISVKEDAGNLKVKITRGGDLTSAVDVPFTVTPGTALTPANYTVVTQSPISFAANETEKEIEITIVDQPGVFTGNKTFSVALGAPSVGVLLNSTATATITDNDAAPKYTLTLVNAPNGQISENGGPLKVKVAWNGGAGGGVKLQTADGVAVSPTDYTAVDQNLTFNAAGDQTIDVPIVNNTTVDGNRPFSVKILNPALGSLASPSVLFVTIVDDDTPQAGNAVTISGQPEVVKTSAGFTITVTRATAGATASVRVKTDGGSAVAGADYTAIDQVVNFAANETSKTVTLIPTGNSVGDKTVNLSLSEPVGLTLGVPSQLTVTIKDVVVNPNPNPNAAPTAVQDYFVVRLGDSVSTGTSVLANDTGATSATIVTNPAAGTVTLNADGTFSYRPAANFPGFDSFTYKASNANGDSTAVKVTVMTHQALQIRKLYKQVLGREPDEGGWVHWTAQVQKGAASLGTVASGIFESDERLNPIITKYYQEYLGRPADTDGLASWRKVWQRDGGSENVIAGMISSNEYYFKAGNTNAGWVTALYQSLLGRGPDAAGLNGWVGYMAAGNTRQNVVLGFVNSDENRILLIKTWYQQYLGRAATEAEITPLFNRMKNGETQRAIQIFLIDTQEYLNTPPPPNPGTANRVV